MRAFAEGYSQPLRPPWPSLWIVATQSSFSRKNGRFHVKGLFFYQILLASSTFFNGTNKHKIMKGCFPTRLLPTRVVALEEVFTCCKGESRIQSLQGHYREIRYLLQYIHTYIIRNILRTPKRILALPTCSQKCIVSKFQPFALVNFDFAST